MTVAVNLMRRDGRFPPGRGSTRSARGAEAARLADARYAPGGHGPRAARHQRAPRRARRRADHAALRPRDLARLPPGRPLPGRRPRGRRGAVARAAARSPDHSSQLSPIRRRTVHGRRRSRSRTSSASWSTGSGSTRTTSWRTPNATFEDMGLDSLAFVEIQLAMQQEYGFTIPDEDAERIKTVGAGDRVREPAPRREGRSSRWRRTPTTRS